MAVWKPHPGKQELALRLKDDVFETLYGGARGGGKTEAGLAWLLRPYMDSRYRGLVIRRNADDLSDWVDRARKMYRSVGAKIAYRPAVITFPSGAVIRTGHLKDAEAYTKYQGHEYQRLLIEELTQIPYEKMYIQLLASCRSPYADLRPRVFATSNPGNSGHGWVKKHFIDPARPMQIFRAGGRQRVFIPARVDDNPTVMENDPEYIEMLDNLKETDEQLWRAWRWGDWDVFIGQVFSEWRRELHTVEPIPYPISKLRKSICFDWGFNAPGCAIFLGVAPPNAFGVNRVYAYREIYQNGKTPEDWAKQLAVLTKLEDIEYIVLPHDCFAKPQGGTSIADVFSKHLHCRIIAAHTLQRGARINRVAITHMFLGNAKDGLPNLQVSTRCLKTIETLPTLVYDETNVEDVDTEGDDHAYDALSTGLVTIQQQYKLLSGSVRHKLETKKKTWTVKDDGSITQTVDVFAEIKRQQAKKHKDWKHR